MSSVNKADSPRTDSDLTRGLGFKTLPDIDNDPHKMLGGDDDDNNNLIRILNLKEGSRGHV